MTWKERRIARKTARAEHEDEPEVKVETAASTPPEPEPAPLTPSPEPAPLPEWKGTTVPKTSDEDKTVGDWIRQGVTKICDEHKLMSLTAWRDPAGNVVVDFMQDTRAMYALRKA